MFYRGGRHCIFMLHTKTNTDTMVYRTNNKLDFRAHFENVLFVVFSVLGWMSKTCFLTFLFL